MIQQHQRRLHEGRRREPMTAQEHEIDARDEHLSQVRNGRNAFVRKHTT
jgi:hypothetical protein